MTTKKTAAVIGAGIVGACSAAWLQRKGFDVTIIDRHPPGSQTSFGNAGSLSPSAILPVGMPGMMKRVPSWLLDRNGPLRVRWSYAPRAASWLWQFLRYSEPQEVRRISAAMRSLLQTTFDDYDPLIRDAGLQDLVRRNGCLYVYDNAEEMAAARFGIEVRRENGAVLEELDGPALRQMEPSLNRRFTCALYAPENGSILDPGAFTSGIVQSVCDHGGAFLSGDVSEIQPQTDGIRLNIGGSHHVFDKVAIAAGAWSLALMRQLGDAPPLETQRGYHATVMNPNSAPSRTVMWPARNLMTNPMAIGMRFAGTVEFAGLEAAPDMERAKALLRLGQEMYPDLRPQEVSEWMGHRPCFPDSLPVIDTATRDDRICYAMGHQHVGMCGGAPTGRMVAEILAGEPPGTDLAPFHVNRF